MRTTRFPQGFLGVLICTLASLGGRALPNAERHLRSLDDLRLFYPAPLLR
ncbi:hypothetical protein [Thiolapillus sp.]